MPIAPKQKMTVEQLAAIFLYDATTGKVFWKIKPKQGRVQAGDVAGCTKKGGYVRIRCGGESFLAHRIAWALHHGEWPSAFIDHKNRNRSDNRIENLRECSHAENMRNRPKAHSNKTGFKGVWQEGRMFRASIALNGGVRKLGTFASAEEAHFAYQKAAKQLHEEYASF